MRVFRFKTIKIHKEYNSRIREAVELLEVLLEHEQQQTAARLAHGVLQRPRALGHHSQQSLRFLIVLLLI